MSTFVSVGVYFKKKEIQDKSFALEWLILILYAGVYSTKQSETKDLIRDPESHENRESVHVPIFP